MYQSKTKGIRVSVEPDFLPEHSEPEDSHFFWSYTVEIINETTDPVQLKSRYWKIIDGNGETSDVRGQGVVGEQPVIDPGESYVYTSGVPLSTSSGFMSGSYQMVTGSGDIMDVEIPAFSLDTPEARRSLN